MNFVQLNLFAQTVRTLKSLVQTDVLNVRLQPSHLSKNNVSAEYTNQSELLRLWTHLADTYFPEYQDLKNYKIVWSHRHQSSCLASINLQKKVVRVAPAMKLKESYYFLSPLLYHEMCHAIIGIKVERGRRKIHTREFKHLESQHPEIKLLDQWIKAGGWHLAARKAKMLFNL